MGFLKPKAPPPPPPPPPRPPVPSATPTYHQKSMASKSIQAFQANQTPTVLTSQQGLLDDPNIVYKKKLGD
jgi:hypothetical protein